MSNEEVVHPQGQVVTPTDAPAANPYDTANEAYANLDKAAELETALDAALEGEESESEAAPEVEAEPEDDKFASKFAALSRRDKELRERESEVNNKLALLEEKLEALQNPAAPEPEAEPEVVEETLAQYKRRLSSDPLGTLSADGLSYEQLTELALNDGKLTQDMQMKLMREELEGNFKSELEGIKSSLAKKEEEEIERQKETEEKQYEQVVNDYKQNLTNFINDTQEFELIRANDSVDLVFDVIEDYHAETGRVLDMQEAAAQVEAYLEEEVDRIVNKTQKLKAKFGISQEKAEEIVKAQEQPGSTQSPTLSNANSTMASKSSRPRTRDESVLTAASLLKWND